MKDDVFGAFAIGPCIEYGDSVLPLVEQETKSFTQLDALSARRLAELLSNIRTERCESLSKELWARDCQGELGTPLTSGFEDNPAVLAKALGAVALARQGKLDAPPAEVAFLVDCIAGRYKCGDTSREFCAWALGFSRCEGAVPALIALVPETLVGEAPGAVLDALALLGDTEAITPIRDSLAETHTSRATPLGPPNAEAAVRALVLLGDSNLIPFLIEQMPQAPVPNEHWILDSLREMTDQDLGADPGAWEVWWRNVEEIWEHSDDLIENMRAGIMPDIRDTWNVVVSGDSEIVY
ncbi:MAG: hypothetical protein GY851_34955 [bacterium]|nr:hypothetical protein [bacterium]